MKFLFVTIFGESATLAQQLLDEGHRVRFFIRDKKMHDVGRGLIPMVRNWKKHKDWPDVFVFDDVEFGEEIENLRKRGYLVVGGNRFGDKLENDRLFAQKIMREVKMKLPLSWRFRSFSRAIEFIKKRPKRYVIKISGQPERYTCYIGKSPDGLDLLKVVENLSEQWTKRGKKSDFTLSAQQSKRKRIDFILQEWIDGVEMACGAFFNGKDFVYPINISFEHKNFLTGGLGPLTGEMGTSLFYSEDGGKLFRETLSKIRPYLAKTNYRGFIDLNSIVTEKGAYPIDFTCYDAATEIWAENGWKPFKNLKIGERVATLNPKTHSLEWQKVRKMIKKKYKGEMIRIHNQEGLHSSIDMMVTPDHKVYILDRGSKKGRFVRANKLTKSFYLKKTFNYQGKAVKYFILPQYIEKHFLGKSGQSMNIIHEAKKIKMDDWLAFLGLYLSEGSNNGYIVTIHQYDKEKKEKIRKLLNKLPFRIVELKGGFQTSSIQLATYLKKLGLANQKYILNEFKRLSKRQLAILLDYLILGDGNIHSRTGQRTYYSTSKKLADDVQELFFKIGSVANIRKAKVANTNFVIRGKKYTRRYDGYFVAERKIKRDAWIDKRVIFKKFYNGYVYCCEVPNHIIFVRKNGKPVWGGNCRFGYPQLDIQQELHKTSWGELLYKLAEGSLKQFEAHKKFAVGVIVGGAGMPYEISYNKYGRNLPILGINKENQKYVKLAQAYLRDGKLYTAGTGYVLTVNGSGKTMEAAKKRAYEIVNQITIPNAVYRLDIGDHWKKEESQLKAWGYI